MVFSCWVVGAFGQVLHENVSQIGHSYGLFGMAPTDSLFAWLISHQPAVLFSQNESATSNQPQLASSTPLRTNQHQPPANRTGCELLCPKTLCGASSGWSYSCPKCVFGYQLQK
jgi:hypothetical protein